MPNSSAGLWARGPWPRRKKWQEEPTREPLTATLLSALVGLKQVQEYTRTFAYGGPLCEVEDCTAPAAGLWQDDQRRGYSLCTAHAALPVKT